MALPTYATGRSRGMVPDRPFWGSWTSSMIMGALHRESSFWLHPQQLHVISERYLEGPDIVLNLPNQNAVNQGLLSGQVALKDYTRVGTTRTNS
jgi:hypothetical protein